jgi:hypothetical protein
MEKFASTSTLMELLGSGDYKRPVMENEEDALDLSDSAKAETTFSEIFDDYKTYASRPDAYDYFASRQVK